MEKRLSKQNFSHLGDGYCLEDKSLQSEKMGENVLLKKLVDYNGLLMLSSMTMTDCNPEFDFKKIMDETQRVRQYCDTLLDEFSEA